MSPRSSGPKARSLLNEIFDKEFTLVLRNDSTAARAMALTSGPGCMRQIDLKMTFMQDFVKKKIVDVQKIGTLNHDPPEIAEITKYVKVSVVHVQKHLSALLVVASILGSAAGVEDDYDREEDWKQGWSAKTVILFVVLRHLLRDHHWCVGGDKVLPEEVVGEDWDWAEESAHEDDGH